MKLLRGLAVILAFLALGDGASAFAGIPVPGSVVGMVLFASALGLGLVKAETVKVPAEFLAGNLSFFFVPAGVGLMSYFDILGSHWPAILVAVVPGTLVTLVLVGLLHSFMTRRRTRP